MVAGLVSRAEDWPWSSTRAQLAGVVTTVAPLRALIPDFAALLAMPTDATTTRIERAPTIDRPLGRPEWIAMLERRLGRPLAPRKLTQTREWARHRAARAMLWGKLSPLLPLATPKSVQKLQTALHPKGPSWAKV